MKPHNILAVKCKAGKKNRSNLNNSVQLLITIYSLNEKNFVETIIYHAAKTGAEVISNIVVLVTKENEF